MPRAHRFTEEDVQRRVEEALKQSKEEAEFAQREIEDLRKRLAAEVENNRQMTLVSGACCFGNLFRKHIK